MVDLDQLNADFKALCEKYKLTCPNICMQQYRIDDHYYQTHNYVWDQISDEENGHMRVDDDLDVDIDAWFRHNNPNPPDDLEVCQELFELLDSEGSIFDHNNWIDDDGDLLLALEGKKYVDLPDDMKADVDSWWADLEISIIDNEDFIKEALEIECLECEYSKSAAVEVLSYWCTYYEPRIKNVEAAHKSGLFPFEYEGTFMLALGGCGMDLSPKLDCYQALTDRSIPSNSTIFRQLDYFDYVSNLNHEEIFKRCRLNSVAVKFQAYEEVTV